MGKTKIDWCDETVNFITGCRGGCAFCYARRAAARNARMGSARYLEVQKYTGDPFSPAYHHHVMEKERDRLARATRPRVVFIGSMSDLAHHGQWLYLDGTGRGLGEQRADDWWVQEMIRAFCAKLPRHTFILLTKKPEHLTRELPWTDNVCLGVSVTSNQDLLRIHDLRKWRAEHPCNTTARLPLWASVEPLLDPDFDEAHLEGLDWVVVGAQTGPGAKPNTFAGLERYGENDTMVEVTRGETIIEAAERIVWWCADHGVPCFVKDNLRQLTHRYRPPMEWPREFPAAFEGRGR